MYTARPRPHFRSPALSEARKIFFFYKFTALASENEHEISVSMNPLTSNGTCSADGVVHFLS